jgi:hypothetical protein
VAQVKRLTLEESEAAAERDLVSDDGLQRTLGLGALNRLDHCLEFIAEQALMLHAEVKIAESIPAADA